MHKRIKFRVTITDGFWTAWTDEIAGGLPAASLAELKRDVETVSRAVWPDEALEISYLYDIQGELGSELDAYRKAKAAAERAQALTAEAARRAARALTSVISERDAAELMGLSKQRVHQLKTS
ncbi:MAG TPA: hypothetical protein VNW94_02970 [Streptosporangiaceae bacterium]|nr:hypothetical protein [Streptosporangiaceae bacterium]